MKNKYIDYFYKFCGVLWWLLIPSYLYNKATVSEFTILVSFFMCGLMFWNWNLKWFDK